MLVQTILNFVLPSKGEFLIFITHDLLFSDVYFMSITEQWEQNRFSRTPDRIRNTVLKGSVKSFSVQSKYISITQHLSRAECHKVLHTQANQNEPGGCLPAFLPEFCQGIVSAQRRNAPRSAATLRTASARSLSHGQFWCGPPRLPSGRRKMTVCCYIGCIFFLHMMPLRLHNRILGHLTNAL